MVNIEQKEGGFLIAKKLLFGATVPHEKYINLAIYKWENLFYEKMPFKLVDFPGEYDIDGILIKAYLWKQNKLSFVITTKTKRLALIQTSDILDHDDVWDMDAWLYLDTKIADKIDGMELEWEKYFLWEDGAVELQATVAEVSVVVEENTSK